MRSLAVLAAAMAGVTVLTVTPALAQTTTPQPPPAVTVNPTSGPAGSGITISWSGFINCKGLMNFAWDGAALTSTAYQPSGSIAATVPAGTAVGSHILTAADGCRHLARTTFRVTPPVTTTTPPPVTTTTTQPRPPVTTTTRPGVTTTTTPPATTTTTTTTTTTDSSSSSSTRPSGPGDGVLVLDKDNIQPGDPLTATGVGCPANAPVTLKSMGENVGKAVADDKGSFTAPVRFTTIEPGRHVVRAECGIVLLGNVDVSLSSSTGGTTSTLVVLVFFVLIGATMLRRQFTGLRATA